MKNEDEIIIEGIKRNDDKAFKTLFDTYYNPLFYVSRQYIFDEYVAESLVSELFCKIWETRTVFNIQTSLKSYLFKGIRNLSLNYIRDNYRHNHISINDLDISSPLLFVSDEYPLGTLLEKELTEKINCEIEALPNETQQVFILSKIDGLKNNEIADMLGISVNTVKYHMKKAFSVLRLNLKEFLYLFLL